MSRPCICGHVQHRARGGGCLTTGCKCTRLRCFAGMTLRELAEVVGVCPSMMSRFFGGTRHLSPELFRKTAEALGMSPEQLLVEVSRRRQLWLMACQ